MTERVINSDWLFQQTDYRAVLRHAYGEKKKRNPRFSYAVWARQLGISSRSTLAMLLNGQRHPGDELVGRIATSLGLSSNESQYFSDLVTLQKKANQDVAVTLSVVERLRKRRKSASFRFVDFETLEAISNWHYLAIREMTRLGDFREDVGWICDRLRYKITPKQVTQAIRVLLERGFLERMDDGRLRAREAELDIGTDLRSLAVQRLHREALELAREGLDKVRPQDRDYQMMSFVMDASDLEEARKWVRKFQNDFCDRFEKAGGDQLFQLQVYLNPLTRRIG